MIFIFRLKATDEKEEMESLRAYNLKLVANILPLHVAEHFLKRKSNKEEVCCVFLPINYLKKKLFCTSEEGKCRNVQYINNNF